MKVLVQALAASESKPRIYVLPRDILSVDYLIHPEGKSHLVGAQHAVTELSKQ
jgi:hypothetical protein